MSPFLDIPRSDYIFETDDFFLIYDRFPVSPGHLLIISKQLRSDYFELTSAEKAALPELIDKARSIIEEQYQPDGYNIGMNCGEIAGQSVWHCHVHLIPRRKGDVEYPKGGVRHVIPYKGNYEDLR